MITGACASAGSPRPQSGSAAGLELSRVLELLRKRHLSQRPLDAELAERALERLLPRPSSGAQCLRSPHVRELRRHPAALATQLRRGQRQPLLRALQACAGPQPAGELRSRLLDGIAGAYDPHTRFVDGEQLRRLRAAIHSRGPQVPQTDAAATQVSARMLSDGSDVGLVVIPAFYLRPDRSTSRDVDYLVSTLVRQGARVVVLDLRGNGGGVMAEVEKLASLFLPPGVLAYERDASGRLRPLRSRGGPAHRVPLVLAVDRSTASAAELFAATMQDRGRALVVGERTQGKGVSQELILLASPLGEPRGALNITAKRLFRADGRGLQRAGVAPDLSLPALHRVGPREADRPWAVASMDLQLARSVARAVPTPDPAGLDPTWGELQALGWVARSYLRLLPRSVQAQKSATRTCLLLGLWYSCAETPVSRERQRDSFDGRFGGAVQAPWLHLSRQRDLSGYQRLLGLRPARHRVEEQYSGRLVERHGPLSASRPRR